MPALLFVLLGGAALWALTGRHPKQWSEPTPPAPTPPLPGSVVRAPPNSNWLVVATITPRIPDDSMRPLIDSYTAQQAARGISVGSINLSQRSDHTVLSAYLAYGPAGGLLRRGPQPLGPYTLDVNATMTG